MAVEPKRGCGYRKIGGLYLVGNPGGFSCDRLPFPLTTCPTCGAGIKFSRGWTWVFPYNLFEGDHAPCYCKDRCPICHPLKMGEKAGLMWVGEQFYTPQTFVQEALTLGISKRIPAVPQGLQLGKTWVLIAHKKGALHQKEGRLFKTVPGPGIFYAFVPTRVEKVVTYEDLANEQEMRKLERRGITPVPVPANDPDHQ